MFWSALVDQCRLFWDFTEFSARVSLLGASQNWLCSGQCRGTLKSHCCVGPREKGFSVLTHSTSCLATLCAPEPFPHIVWTAREVCEENGNQYYSVLCFAMEKGRTKDLLVSNAASSPFWKEAVQVPCCPGSCLGFPGTCWGTACSFLFTVGL